MLKTLLIKGNLTHVFLEKWNGYANGNSKYIYISNNTNINGISKIKCLKLN